MPGADNFTGEPVPGYDAPECVLVRQAAEALKAVQADVSAKGLTLKVYDCYRPARAVAAFVAWAKLPDDPKAKAIYYPNLTKSALFPDYIATRSGHSRGATLDLTLAARSLRSREAETETASRTPAPRRKKSQAPDGSLAMGTSFDCFDVKANTAAPGLSRGGAGQSRDAGRGHAGARLQELPDGVVALHACSRSPTPTRSSISRSCRGGSRPLPGYFVAVDALAPLVALLRLDAQGRDRPGIEPLQADRLAGLLAIAVSAVVEPHDARRRSWRSACAGGRGPEARARARSRRWPGRRYRRAAPNRRADAGGSPWSSGESRRAS